MSDRFEKAERAAIHLVGKSEMQQSGLAAQAGVRISFD